MGTTSDATTRRDGSEEIARTAANSVTDGEFRAVDRAIRDRDRSEAYRQFIVTNDDRARIPERDPANMLVSADRLGASLAHRTLAAGGQNPVAPRAGRIAC